jgi:hypothetical protein
MHTFSVGKTKRSEIVICCVLTSVVLVAFIVWLDGIPWRADFSKWRPASVYQMVMGSPVPSGVTSLRVSGRHFFTKRWVWMSFHATPAVINKSGFQKR